jgi:nitrate reductase gamma subunit
MGAGKFLHFAEFDLQIIALSVFGILYAIKAWTMARLPMRWENAPAKGSPAAGVLYSYAATVAPWMMSSATQHWTRWLGFGLYHIGAGLAILSTFTLPFTPKLMEPAAVRFVFAVLVGLAFIVGAIRLWRRFKDPTLKVISTPDDYFSLAAVEVFFFLTVMTLVARTDGWRLAYFLVTAAFLFYVPFSKISHYVYWFFARVLMGVKYGRRGVMPRTGGAR